MAPLPDKAWWNSIPIGKQSHATVGLRPSYVPSRPIFTGETTPKAERLPQAGRAAHPILQALDKLRQVAQVTDLVDQGIGVMRGPG